ncbi:MAG: NAD(P)H-hydrate dehydratase [Brevinematia bacterium]
MYIATKEDIYFIDQQCEKKYNIPTSELMENAGKNSFLWIKDKIKDYKSKKFLIFCAHGNNGGDGAVLARYLAEDGVNLTTVFLGDVTGRSKDVARENFIKLKKINANIIEVDLNDKSILEIIKKMVSRCDIIVDAIFGIGFNGEFFSPFIEIINEINASGKKIISLDIPSGVMANGGNFNLAIKADYTLTFGFPKYGMIDYPGARFCGEINVIDIGILEALTDERRLPLLLTDDYIKGLILRRERDTHKGKYGHLLIIGGYGGDFVGGFRAMGGSVILAGIAALKAGVGLLTIAGHLNVLSSIQSQIPEAMTFGWLEKPSSIKGLKRLIENSFIRSVLIGNGFSKGIIQREILKMVIQHPIVNKIVIDADGINILSEDRKLLETLASSGKEVILTPHIGEAARLLRLHPDEVKNNKLEIAKNLVRLTASTVILKDSVSVVAGKEEELFINNRGSVTLAKGGSGDILAGLIAGLFTSGYSPVASACVGIYTLGIAGEKCEAEKGEVSPLGRDILSAIKIL